MPELPQAGGQRRRNLYLVLRTGGRVIPVLCPQLLWKVLFGMSPRYVQRYRAGDLRNMYRRLYTDGMRGIHVDSQENHNFIFARTPAFEQWLARSQLCPCCRAPFTADLVRRISPINVNGFNPNDPVELWLYGRELAIRNGFRYQPSFAAAFAAGVS